MKGPKYLFSFFSFLLYFSLFILYSFSPCLIASQLPGAGIASAASLASLSPLPLASQLPAPPRMPPQQRPRPCATRRTDGRVPAPRRPHAQSNSRASPSLPCSRRPGLLHRVCLPGPRSSAHRHPRRRPLHQEEADAEPRIRGIRVQLTLGPHAQRMEPEEASFFSSGRVVHLHSAGFQGILAWGSLARGRLAEGAVKRLQEPREERYQTALSFLWFLCCVSIPRAVTN